MDQLVAEGMVQRLWLEDGFANDPLVAAVGKLQFEALQYRLNDEDGVETSLTPLPYECAAWLEGERASFREPTTSRARRSASIRSTSCWITREVRIDRA